ncbi:flavin-containing monooxygenase [Mycolicibacterium monacense]|uniref:Monooxygenase n=2 Tax=Mycobacteriaceae TaxID=1762 RepID=A0AAD1MWG4_MYCMB|nr:NAD(P)/FAD-dependent oxidoreductase [Mycolicibacterium monacense]MDA4101099.1 4-hydroxyacetophenone monooxygenase [Mycolicibacterium monacense DSM 44395]ORB16643.1 4-hydroxyacetophenone monooxygenase [Mycolicibacterium monacense DSM 44395]QHP86475.1 NAD(P)/FAD-dependent oxidoreductase [Mycolicibacterium monacense DSM 44395]BBZ60488.1 monooxygenase [Mycolicibacterium monacense]
MRNPHAGQPFTDPDERIADALLDVSIPTLMMSLVHMSGDASLIRGALRPAGLFLNEVQGYMSEEDKAAVRALALPIIADYWDRGCPEPAPIRPELLHEMMQWLVCEEVPAEYVPMLLEEMELDGRDDRAVPPPADPARAEFPVLVIGCGESGLLAGIRLKEAGIPFTIVERNTGVGGTWWQNTYPGARVDVGNHFYCYSFEPSDRWTHFFAEQPELQAYFQEVFDRHEMSPHVRFGTEVTELVWDEDTGTWTAHMRDLEGAVTSVRARAVISAVGQLNRPHTPAIEGQHDFGGPAFHSAEWDHSVDLRGREVAMIGAGASGFQIAPAIAPKVNRLTVFQRTAQWMFPNPNYHAPVGDGVRWALRHLPFYGRWYRFLLFWPGCDKGLAAARVDPDYPDPQRAVSEVNDIARMMFTEWITSQVGDDADLLAKVLPDYPATGKRTLQDNGSWLRTLTRDNVELVRTGIARIEPDAVVTEDGTRYPADVIVYATGFHANRMLWPMRVVGRGGAVLGEVWGERPSAYLGITVPEFPNFFCMYGPGTNLAHGGSLIFHSECQMRYIAQCLELLIDGGHRWLQPREQCAQDWCRRTQEELGKLVWSQPSVEHSFYKNSHGEIYTLSPWRLVDYWTWTRRPEPRDFEFG